VDGKGHSLLACARFARRQDLRVGSGDNPDVAARFLPRGTFAEHLTAALQGPSPQFAGDQLMVPGQFLQLADECLIVQRDGCHVAKASKIWSSIASKAHGANASADSIPSKGSGLSKVGTSKSWWWIALV
jgi:hypothetical protein